MDIVEYTVMLSHFGHIKMVSLFILKNTTTIAFLKYEIHVMFVKMAIAIQLVNSVLTNG